MTPGVGDEVAAVIEVLDAGGEPDEGVLTKLLRRPGCPGEVIDRLGRCRWLLGSPRPLQLFVRHPRCPSRFAWEALPRLGWHDLVEVARDPRTAPAVRKQAERKLIERVATLTLGERTALARVAPRGVLAALLASTEPTCIAALLDNPKFTESEALRLFATNRNSEALLTVLRHPVWGRRLELVRAAIRNDAVPLGVALGLLASLPVPELARVAGASGVRFALRSAARRLAARRMQDDQLRGAGPSPT